MNTIDLYERVKLLEHRFKQLENCLDIMDKHRFTNNGDDIIEYENNYTTARSKRRVIHMILDEIFEEIRGNNEDKVSE
jgi:hypothetical protein